MNSIKVHKITVVKPQTDYPDGDDGEDGRGITTPVNEKETDKAVSFSGRGAYTSRVVEVRGVEPRSGWVRDRFSPCAAVSSQS